VIAASKPSRSRSKTHRGDSSRGSGTGQSIGQKRPSEKEPTTERQCSSIRPTKEAQIYKTGNLTAVQVLLGHTKPHRLETMVPYLAIEGGRCHVGAGRTLAPQAPAALKC
jgi:hypothetical protein